MERETKKLNSSRVERSAAGVTFGSDERRVESVGGLGESSARVRWLSECISKPERDFKINEGRTLTFSQCKIFINVIIPLSVWC